jgi:hypothetical protein
MINKFDGLSEVQKHAMFSPKEIELLEFLKMISVAEKKEGWLGHLAKRAVAGGAGAAVATKLGISPELGGQQVFIWAAR